MTSLTKGEVKFLAVGESIMYRNQYEQYFTGRIVSKRLDDYGRLFFFVKRPEWPREECLAYSDFCNGTYEVIN